MPNFATFLQKFTKFAREKMIFLQISKNFNAAKCQYNTLTEYNQLIEIAVERNYISSKDISKLKDWRKNPSIWNQQ